MEKDNFSAEQDNIGQPSEAVEYPEFNPDEAKKLRETEAVEMAFWDQKKNFLENVETEIINGNLPKQLKEREDELWTIKPKVEELEYFSEDSSGADHLTDYMRNLDTGQIRRRHEVSLPINILENPEYPHIINHELAHGLEGYRDNGLQGLNRLFENENNYLGMCLNEGMTEHMVERISGQKINYNINEEGTTVGYPDYYKFIKFLSSAGATKVDMKYFVDAYCLSGEEGDQAITTLRNKLAEAFPTENGTNPLDNLAAHNQDQIEYWISAYTQNI